MLEEIEKYSQVSKIIRPVDRLPKQVFLLGQRYPAFERIADVAIAVIASHADSTVFVCKSFCDLPRAVGRAIVDEHNFIVARYSFEKVDRLPEELANRVLFVVGVAD
jgi:hypothetical protein